MMAMTACGSNSDSNTGASGGNAAAVDAGDGGDAGSGLGPTLTVTFDVSGETALKGDTTSTAPTDNGQSPQSCAAYAKGDASEDGKIHYVLPTFLNGDIGGKHVLINALVEDYKGPGTYDLDGMAGPGGGTDIEVDQRAYADQPDTSSGKVEVDGKGGGTFTFTRLAFSDGNGQVSPGISGKVSWTCKN
ncbi:hypothetical protein Raf01_49930 [Rugosimonospora africana]|uniref:Uncharacterized protein n=2 Tax=Rugosimonospora africana TaxID=556532 RepID=A0A8J3QY55_9ACTN|nr:hypothetical protein Raf01_49930 [Rugosimonospora africana]